MHVVANWRPQVADRLRPMVKSVDDTHSDDKSRMVMIMMYIVMTSQRWLCLEC